MNWIVLTVLAAFMQTLRNALQAKLSTEVSIAGVTLARFIFAVPMALAYLALLYQFKPQPVPDFTATFMGYVAVASVMQIIATLLMVSLFKQKNFAIGAGLAKSEALAAAVLSTLFFGSQHSALGWVGIMLGALAVFVLSGVTQRAEFSVKVVITGLACGVSFALTSLYIREASMLLGIAFPHNAAWVLLWVLTLQTLMLCGYVFLREKTTISQLRQHKKTVLAVSATSCIGSIGWFSAMSLQYVAYVKTLGQIEVLFTIAVAVLWLKQPVKRYEVAGLVLISLAAIFVMWG